MITRQEIKKVEELQKIEKTIKLLEEDYNNTKYKNIAYVQNLRFAYLNYDYNKELSRIIKHKILKLKRKRKELLEEN